LVCLGKRIYLTTPSRYSTYKILPKEFKVDLSLYPTPLALAMEVLRRFQPSQLLAHSENHGLRTEELPDESLFQMEFYRGLHKVLGGEVLPSPESIPIKGKGVAFSGGVYRRLNSTRWRNPNIVERSRGGAVTTILRSDCATLIFWSGAVGEL
jgi:hypothetical protein